MPRKVPKLSKKLVNALLKATAPTPVDGSAALLKLARGILLMVEQYQRDLRGVDVPQPHHRRETPEATLRAGADLLAQGVSYRKASKAVGCSYHALWSYMNKP